MDGMNMMLFVGGPWAGHEWDVADELDEVRVGAELYVRRKVGAVMDGQRYVREVMVHTGVADPDVALGAMLLSLWVRDGGPACRLNE